MIGSVGRSCAVITSMPKIVNLHELNEKITCRYLGAWNMFAVDLKNEPHDSATWGDNNMRTDWRLAAERLGNMILASALNTLLLRTSKLMETSLQCKSL